MAEKPGVIKVFDGLDDTTPTSSSTCGRRSTTTGTGGCSGLALDPDFPAKPYVYALYTYDAPSAAPPRPGTTTCPTRRARPRTGAWSARRLSRLTAQGDQAVGAEQVLIEDWCQQCPTHSIGDLALRPRRRPVRERRRRRRASTSWTTARSGSPRTRAATRRRGVGGTQTPPTTEGGALRSQDLRTTGDPTTPGRHASCAWTRPPARPCPSTRSAGSTDPNARRIIAYGLRNPFRFAIRPGTSTRSGSATWAGTPGRRSTAIAHAADRPRRELRVAVLRGQRRASPATTPPT